MRKPVRSAVANRKYFQGGGLAPMKPAAPEEAVGIMASSQPLVDMIAQNAGNPQGGMSPLNFDQGGLFADRPRVRGLLDSLKYVTPQYYTSLAAQGLSKIPVTGIGQYFTAKTGDPILEKKVGAIDAIKMYDLIDVIGDRTGKRELVDKIGKDIVANNPQIKPRDLEEQIMKTISLQEAEKEGEKLLKETEKSKDKLKPFLRDPEGGKFEPDLESNIIKDEKGIEEGLKPKPKPKEEVTEDKTKEITKDDEIIPEGTSAADGNIETEELEKEAEVIKQNTNPEAQDTTQSTEDKLGMLMKRFTDAAPEYEGVDKGLALMQMGALMAGGTSPNAIKNIADALTVTSEKLIKDDSKRKQFNQQLQLSALQYGLGEISKLDADERARELFEFQKSFEFENFYDQNNNLVQVSKADLAKNGLPTEDADGNPIELKTSDFIKNLMDKNAAIQTQNFKVLKELNVSSKELGEFQKEYGTAVDKTIKATNTMRLLESIITKNVKGELTGFKPAFKDLLSKAAAAGGVDINQSYESKAEGIANLKIVLQNMIPLTLGKDQAANSISNFDVNMLAEALFTDAVRTKGIFDSLTTTPKRVLDKKLRTTYGLLEDNRLSTINTLNSLEQRGSKFIVGLDPNQTLGSQVASERERLQPYLEGVKGVTGLELPTLEFNKDTNVYKIPGLK